MVVVCIDARRAKGNDHHDLFNRISQITQVQYDQFRLIQSGLRLPCEQLRKPYLLSANASAAAAPI